MDKPKIGRPPKPAEERRTAQLLLKTTPAERELIDAAAGAEPVTVWAREVLLRAARRRV